MKPRVIMISGPDAAGKTTHTKLLVSYLKSRCIKVHVTWLGSQHLIMHLINRLLVSISHLYIIVRGSKVPHPIILAKSRLNRIIGITLEFLNVLPAFILKVKLPKFLGYSVIVEKGLAGTIADLVYAYGYSYVMAFPIKFLLRLLCEKDNSLIFLDISYKEHLKRRGENCDLKSYIEVQRRIYRWLNKIINHSVLIDTSKLSISETQSLLRGFLEKCLRL